MNLLRLVCCSTWLRKTNSKSGSYLFMGANEKFMKLVWVLGLSMGLPHIGE